LAHNTPDKPVRYNFAFCAVEYLPGSSILDQNRLIIQTNWFKKSFREGLEYKVTKCSFAVFPDKHQELMLEGKLPGNPTAQKIMLWLLRLLMRLLLRFEITNLENIPPTGPMVVVINHIAWLDPIMVLGGFPRTVIPMTKTEAFNLFLIGQILNIYGAIPVRRGQADLNAIKLALRVLRSGGVVLLAPEGTRSPTRQLQYGKDGAVMIALRSDAAIVPVGVTGTHRVNAHWLKLKRAPVHLSAGKPFRLRPSSIGGCANRTNLEAMTHEVMYRLALQLPEKFRGVYRNPEKVTENYLTPVEG
jgi:1-acyl-sn-glycerol-3-phosphate acyltransferase